MILRIDDWDNETWIQVDDEPLRTITIYVESEPAGEFASIDDAFNTLVSSLQEGACF